MIDLNKERELFVAFLRTKGILKIAWNCMGVITNIVREADCDLSYSDIEIMQEVWMEKAKAQTVPETHLLIPREPNRKTIMAMACVCLGSVGSGPEFLTLKEAKDVYSALVEKESGAEG
ncbi:hypothetical protein [Acinetobacter baumannii]|uniref:hypothetical protein n=1 Tax=Acinetobacter baumannii TaxID=470 RepID=UPI0037BE9A44